MLYVVLEKNEYTTAQNCRVGKMNLYLHELVPKDLVLGMYVRHGKLEKQESIVSSC